MPLNSETDLLSIQDRITDLIEEVSKLESGSNNEIFSYISGAEAHLRKAESAIEEIRMIDE